ncbi:MAG: hypothetical protein L6Q95_08825, partial [Planctomycetes bacterium]|nr:hypothetical protein [Planctomycetota bacterium]
MSELLGALVLLFGGVGIGFALAKWRHRAALGFALLVLAGVGGVLLLLVPRSQERTICRMLEGIWSKDAHPY